jgi:BASS family bile acid:Na+ symporter
MLDGPVPGQVLTVAAAATVFTVMFDLGLGVVLREFHFVWSRPGLVARGLVAVLVIPPLIAMAVNYAFDLPRAAQVGILLMAVSPGAPVALRRSLGAGGHRGFAPALQILVAVLAVLSLPLWVVTLERFHAGRVSVSVGDIARQVFVAQLLPLGLGMLVRRAWPGPASWLRSRITRVSTVLLVVLVVLVLIDIWSAVVGAGVRLTLAIVVIALLTLGAGHALGGPDAATRTAVAVCSEARNAGLALLVATLNHAIAPIVATVLAYLVVSALTAVGYVLWRKHGHAVAVPSPR